MSDVRKIIALLREHCVTTVANFPAEAWKDTVAAANALESLQAENARLTSEVARLREALDRYGLHDRSCDTLFRFGDDVPCTCGFSEALAKP